MKKFSFLLLGAFLLWAMSFVVADESDGANALTWDTAEMPKTETVALIEATTWDTAEVATWDTAEVATWTTVEATTWATAEATTWTTAEATTWATAEATTWTTAEATTWDTAEATTWDTAEATTWDTAEVATWATAEAITWTTAEAATWTTAQSKYNEEQVKAYEWALENGITTINDIEKARLADGLTRAELAKMMSQYMTKVLWQTPAVTEEKANYADVDESLGDLADFIQTAYAYKIMWINADGTPLKKLNPRGKVTRAEYATVFSRVLFGDKYNKSEWNYYDAHLEALKEAEILTNTTPNIQEVRGWVMLMMYRSSQNSGAIEKVANATEKEETSVTTGEVATGNVATTEEWTGKVAQIANPASEYCVAQWGTVNIVKDAEGNESGICKLADGTEVDEWEYFRANNPESETWATTEEPTNSENTETWTGEVATWTALTATSN